MLTIDDCNNKLILASQNGQIESVKSLIKQGADIRAENDRALVIACFNGHYQIVKLLIEYGLISMQIMVKL